MVTAACMSRRAAAGTRRCRCRSIAIGLDGVREPLAVEIANPTSLALGPDGADLYLEPVRGHVYRLTVDDRAELYATELGVPTGLAFAPDGTLFVGDRSGSILRVSPERQVETYRDAARECRRLPSRVRSGRLPVRRRRRRWRRTIRSIASRPIGSWTSSATGSAGRRVWRSTRRACCTSPMRLPAAPDSIASIVTRQASDARAGPQRARCWSAWRSIPRGGVDTGIERHHLEARRRI